MYISPAGFVYFHRFPSVEVYMWGNSISGHTSASRDCWLSGAAYPSLLLPVAIFSRVSLFSSQHHSSLCIQSSHCRFILPHSDGGEKRRSHMKTWQIWAPVFLWKHRSANGMFLFKSSPARLNKRQLFGGVIDQFHEVATSDFSAWHPSTGNGSS